MDDATTLFSVVEIAAKLRLSISKVYRMISIGELPCYKIGRRVLVSSADLIQFLKQHREEPNILPASKRRHF